MTRGFIRNITNRCNRFADKTITPSWQSPRAVSPLVNVGFGEELEGETRSSYTDQGSSYTDQCNFDFVEEEMGILNRKGGKFLNKLYINNEEFR